MVLAMGVEEALEVAARTGQPVIGPPMSEEEAAVALSFSLGRDQPGTGSAGR
jgi:hypothetical protein